MVRNIGKTRVVCQAIKNSLMAEKRIGRLLLIVKEKGATAYVVSVWVIGGIFHLHLLH